MEIAKPAATVKRPHTHTPPLASLGHGLASWSFLKKSREGIKEQHDLLSVSVGLAAPGLPLRGRISHHLFVLFILFPPHTEDTCTSTDGKWRSCIEKHLNLESVGPAVIDYLFQLCQLSLVFNDCGFRVGQRPAAFSLIS